jgi:tRNA nucleotidyltransferase (CCA-adding enzyme)
MSKEVTLEQVKDLAKGLAGRGGKAYFVGGCVRDKLLGIHKLLGIPTKDFDVEVHKLDPASLRQEIEIFSKFNGFTVDEVGSSFTVLKVGSNLDISIPRIEKKTGTGHRAFEIVGDPNLGTFEAARRRDFTINAIMQDVISGEMVDHFNGVEDLKNGIIRVVDPKTFVEDSLRVLRAAQFAARFAFTIDDETVTLCRSIDLNDLPKERIWTEIEKLLLSKHPNLGLGCLNHLGIIDKLFPELHKTLLDQAALKLFRVKNELSDLSNEKKITLLLSTICMSLIGEHAFVDSFLDRLNVQTINNFKVREVIHKLLENLTVPDIIQKSKDPDHIVRVLSTDVEIDLLVRLTKARGLFQEAEWLLTKANELGVLHEAPEPLLMGRHLIETGMKTSPKFKEVLDAIYQQQLKGTIRTLEEAKGKVLEQYG